VVFHNVSQEEEIQKLEQINKYKTLMMASVSHELRTPLNGSMSMLECALEDPKISGSSKEEYIVPALNCSFLLLHLINDILDYGQMNHEALKLTFETIDIRKVVAEI